MLGCPGEEYTSRYMDKKAGRGEKDAGLFKSFISHDGLKVIMENSPSKGYLQDHTDLSHTQQQPQRTQRNSSKVLWQDQDQNLTTSKQKNKQCYRLQEQSSVDGV